MDSTTSTTLIGRPYQTWKLHLARGYDSMKAAVSSALVVCVFGRAASKVNPMKMENKFNEKHETKIIVNEPLCSCNIISMCIKRLDL